MMQVLWGNDQAFHESLVINQATAIEIGSVHHVLYLLSGELVSFVLATPFDHYLLELSG